MAQDLKPVLLTAAQQYGVDPAIAQRVMHIESRGNPNAVSPAGALGAMQLMPGTARELGVDPNDPVQNVQGGVRYLAQMINEFGPEFGPLAYNAGPGRMRRVLAGEAAMPAETQNYQRLMRGDNMPVLQRSVGALNNGGIYDIIGGREGNLKVQDPSQISPEAVAATENINRMQEFKRQMLPLAMGSMMSGDAGSRNYGQNTFREAMEGVEPFKMQNGFLTDEGQYLTDQDQSGLLKMTIDQMRRDQTADRTQSQQNVQGEDRMRDDYYKVIKDADKAIEGYKVLKAMPANAMGDISMIYNYMKTLDPASTVREGEAATVQNAAGVPDRIRNYWNAIQSGQRLTEPQRAEILGIATSLAENAAGVLEGQHKHMGDIAGRRGFTMENIVPQSHIDMVKMVRDDAAKRRQAPNAQPSVQVGNAPTQEGRRGVQSGVPTSVPEGALPHPEGGYYTVENGQVKRF